MKNVWLLQLYLLASSFAYLTTGLSDYQAERALCECISICVELYFLWVRKDERGVEDFILWVRAVLEGMSKQAIVGIILFD